ncbi:MAG: ribonucleotide-diphosphate reductase subunit alpha [Anaerolineae bacterium]|nr:MAG: ribonucleotide-diphosphate reductase subunit alpha [Anaerolineae bacterium]
MKTFSNFFRSVIIGPFAALVIVVVIISLTTDRFLTPGNLTNVSLQVSTVAIAAIGSTIVILTGEIDLSPGAVVALTSSVLAVLVQKTGLSLPVGIILALLFGVLLGGFNGLLSTYIRIPSFVATLATMGIFRGLAFLITEGHPIFSISPYLETIFYGDLAGIPLPLIYLLVFYAISAVYLRNTRQGRAIYSVGGNETASYLSGIHVNRSRLMAFVIAGFTAAIAGVLLSARLNSGSPNYGVALELAAIAAAVIGGTSLAGGYGNIIGTLFGAMTVAVVQNALNLNAVPAAWQNISLGFIILLAVGFDMWRNDVGKGLSRIFSAEVKDS